VNPPKIFTEAKIIAINPKILGNSYKFWDAAIIAPIIITLETALVTDISGACNAGVTLHTT
jgi:hypothetical protein